jgi:hypothetical protein
MTSMEKGSDKGKDLEMKVEVNMEEIQKHI